MFAAPPTVHLHSPPEFSALAGGAAAPYTRSRFGETKPAMANQKLITVFVASLIEMAQEQKAAPE